jgi:hypothetical protein
MAEGVKRRWHSVTLSEHHLSCYVTAVQLRSPFFWYVAHRHWVIGDVRFDLLKMEP